MKIKRTNKIIKLILWNAQGKERQLILCSDISEVKLKPLDEDTEEFLPSQPTEYKMYSYDF